MSTKEKEAERNPEQIKDIKVDEKLLKPEVFILMLLKQGLITYSDLNKILSLEPPSFSISPYFPDTKTIAERINEVYMARLNELSRNATILAGIAFNLNKIVEKKLKEATKKEDIERLKKLKKMLDEFIEEISKVIIPLQNEFLARRYLGNNMENIIKNAVMLLNNTRNKFNAILTDFKPFIKQYLLENQGDLQRITLRKWGITSPTFLDMAVAIYKDTYGKDEEIERVYGKNIPQHLFSFAVQMTTPEVLLTAIDKAFSEEKPGTLRWAFAVSLDILFFSKPLKQTLKYISRDAKLTESAFDRLTKFEIDLFKEEMLKKILIKVEDFWEKYLDSLVKNLTKTLGKEQMEGAARAYFKVGIKGLGEVAYILRTNKDAQKMFAMVYLDFKSIGLSEEAAALIAFNVVAYEIKGGLGHSTRLAILSYLTARNLSLKELTRVRILGYIHDFGKGATIPKEGNLGKNIRGLEPTHNPEGALTDFGRTVIQEGHIISSYHLLENIAELIGREEAQKLFMFLGEGNINTGSIRASEIILKHHPTSLGNTIDFVRRDMLFFSLLDIADAVSSYRLYRNLSAEGAAAIIIRHAINYFGRNEALALLATKNVFLALAHYAGKEVNEELLERALERIFNKLRQRGADFLNLTNLSYELIVETAKNESVLIEIIKAYREKMANESSSILSMYK